MKQPTISFHMKKMEAEWGVKLFEAKVGKIFLTSAGKMLLPYASRISSLYAEAESTITELRENERALLRIGCTDCAMTALVRSNWLRNLGLQHEIRVSIESGSEQSLFERLQAGMLDLILCGQPPADSSEFFHEKIATSPLQLIVPVDDDLTRKMDLAPHDLYKYVFVDHTEHSIHQLISFWRTQLHWTMKVNAIFDSVEMIFGAVQAGLGLAILPKSVLPDPANRVASLDLPGQSAEWSIHAIWRGNYWNPALLRRIVESAFH
jgi:DNA-binding transcriptional LysR family regulator